MLAYGRSADGTFQSSNSTGPRTTGSLDSAAVGRRMALFSRLIHFSSDAFVDQNRIGRLKTYRAAPSQTPSQTAGGRRMALFSRLIRFSSDAFVDQNRIRRLKTYRAAPYQSVLFLCYSGQQ